MAFPHVYPVSGTVPWLNPSVRAPCNHASTGSRHAHLPVSSSPAKSVVTGTCTDLVCSSPGQIILCISMPTALGGLQHSERCPACSTLPSAWSRLLAAHLQHHKVCLTNSLWEERGAVYFNLPWTSRVQVGKAASLGLLAPRSLEGLLLANGAHAILQRSPARQANEPS